MTNIIRIDFALTRRDDGYRVADFFRHGRAAIEAAEDAASPAEADAILRRDYLGADCDGVGVTWAVAA